MQKETDQSNQGDRNRPQNREQGPGWSAAEHERRSRLFTPGGGRPETGGGSQTRDSVYDSFQAHVAQESEIQQKECQKLQEEEYPIISYGRQEHEMLQKMHEEHMQKQEKQEPKRWDQMTPEQRAE